MTKLTEPTEKYPLLETEEWKALTGKLPVRMTNDYLFRALMQSNEAARNGLIASLLGVPVEEVTGTVVENPILLGESIEDKQFYLDLKVSLRCLKTIGFEMQVLNELDWPERSLGYLCRMFDNLNRGQNYVDTRPSYQFAFLDFTLFEGKSEFFSRYKMMNVENHQPYTEKFMIGVVDLTKIGLATEKDRKNKVDLWAKLFKAKTWEEVKALTKEDDRIEQAVSTIFQLIQDDRVRERYEQRERYYAQRRAEQMVYERQRQAIEDQKQAIEDQKQEIEDQKQAIEDQKQEIEDQKQEIEDQKQEIERQRQEIENLRKRLEKQS